MVAGSWVLIKKQWMLLDLRGAHKEGEILSLGYPADTPRKKRDSRQDTGGSVAAAAAEAAAAAAAAAAAEEQEGEDGGSEKEEAGGVEAVSGEEGGGEGAGGGEQAEAEDDEGTQDHQKSAKPSQGHQPAAGAQGRQAERGDEEEAARQDRVRVWRETVLSERPVPEIARALRAGRHDDIPADCAQVDAETPLSLDISARRYVCMHAQSSDRGVSAYTCAGLLYMLGLLLHSR